MSYQGFCHLELITLLLLITFSRLRLHFNPKRDLWAFVLLICLDLKLERECYKISLLRDYCLSRRRAPFYETDVYTSSDLKGEVNMIYKTNDYFKGLSRGLPKTHINFP